MEVGQTPKLQLSSLSGGHAKEPSINQLLNRSRLFLHGPYACACQEGASLLSRDLSSDGLLFDLLSGAGGPGKGPAGASLQTSLLSDLCVFVKIIILS